MILADKIIELRKKNSWSQEELAEQLDVSRQSISKWEGAQSVPDMNRIIRMSEVFGVSTDFLLKDELETPDISDLPTVTDVITAVNIRSVTMEEASAFLEEQNRHASKVSIGAMLCILSPIVLLLVTGAQEAGFIAISEDAAAGIGLFVLIALVGGAAALFVISGMRMEKYEYMEKEPIETAYGISGMTKERQERFRNTYTKFHTTGIVLCVISAIPIFITLFFFGDQEFPMACACAVLLAIVSIGGFLIMRVNTIWDGYQMLLEEGDYSRDAKTLKKKIVPVSIIYWLAVLAVFLITGFASGSNNWKYAGLIWPVAGVIYGIVYTVVKMLHQKG